MPITHRLGRDCELYVEGVLIDSAQDVVVRETVSEIDATAFRSSVQSAIATHRTYEIEVTVADIEVASVIAEYRTRRNGPFIVPGLVIVSLRSGLFDIDKTFTMGPIDADEPLDGLVLPRFAFRQWEDSR